MKGVAKDILENKIEGGGVIGDCRSGGPTGGGYKRGVGSLSGSNCKYMCETPIESISSY